MGCRQVALPLNTLMRLTAFLLCIFFTALSIVPCADSLPQEHSHKDLEWSATDNDHKHTDHKDDCSPLCICACCGTLIALPTLQSLVEARIKISKDYLFHYSFSYSFDYSEAVWHPPSLS